MNPYNISYPNMFDKYLGVGWVRVPILFGNDSIVNSIPEFPE